MNSASFGTVSNRPWRQSSLAWAIRSGREETKFHHRWRGPSIGSPPSTMKRDFSVARTLIRSPGRKTRSWPGPKPSPAISIAPDTV